MPSLSWFRRLHLDRARSVYIQALKFGRELGSRLFASLCAVTTRGRPTLRIWLCSARRAGRVPRCPATASPRRTAVPRCVQARCAALPVPVSTPRCWSPRTRAESRPALRRGPVDPRTALSLSIPLAMIRPPRPASLFGLTRAQCCCSAVASLSALPC